MPSRTTNRPEYNVRVPKLSSPFLDQLAEKVLIFDGATGTQYQALGLSPADFTLTPQAGWTPQVLRAAERLQGEFLEGCNEVLSLTRPDIVAEVHRMYYRAGSDVVETNTFGNTSIVLADYDISELVYDLSVASTRIAKEVAAEFTDRPRFVCGAVGPGTKLVSLGQVSFQECLETYTDAYRGCLDGGADVLLLETLQDLLLMKAGILAAHDAMAATGRQVPLIVQVTVEQTGTMLLGTELSAALNFVECFPHVVAFGMNCATGPAEMVPHIKFLAEHSSRPLSIQPNAGLPEMEAGQAVYRLSPEALAEAHESFVTEHGVALCGGCCGTTPAHIAAVAERVGGRAHSAPAHWLGVQKLFPGFDFELNSPERADAIKLVGCSSLYQFQPYEQDSSFLIIGEKTNANGSKAFRDMLAAENWDGLTELARELEAEGSHLLDVCCAYVGRNEEADMAELLSRYNRSVTVPLMVDSTEVNVIERSLQTLAGKPIVNSINFEDGEERTERVLGLCRRYGAAVVGLTIDEQGMAKTAERKVAIAERLLARTRAFGIPDYDLFLDMLTFTLGSGDEEFRQAGVATIEAIAEIKRIAPRVNTTLGISNISFGLRPAARQVLNSVFLEQALDAGLTSAIVHFSKIKPQDRIDPELWKVAEDLVYDRRVFATSTAG